MDGETQSRHAKGPRACTTCAKAKSRCIPGPTADICERCHRLNKSCSAQTPAPPRKRKAPKITRVAELEKRLEDLTARVESGRALSRTPSEAVSSVESDDPPPRKVARTDFSAQSPARNKPRYDLLFPSITPGLQPCRPRNEGRSPHEQTTPTSIGTDTTTTCIAPSRRGSSDSPVTYREPLHQEAKADDLPWYFPGPQEAQQKLNQFTSHLMGVFPFVVPPRGMTAAQLLRQRPLVWKAIMMAEFHSDSKRQSLSGDHLLKELVANAFVSPAKSLDLLQALEILLVWFHSNSNSFQLTNLLFLVRSICVSFGFKDSQRSTRPQTHDSASLERMRTYAGAYYLVTMTFTTNKSYDAFMNMDYVTECWQALEEHMEYPTDRLAVLLVRTQQLSQSIAMTLNLRNNDSSLPLHTIIASFETQIEILRDSVPEDLRDHVILTCQRHIVETLLYEIAIPEEASASLAPTTRIELLWKCARAVTSALEARFNLQKGVFPNTFCLASYDYTFSMLTSLKLSTLTLPGWDLRAVRKQVDFDGYLLVQIQQLWDIVLLRNPTPPLGTDSAKRNEANQQKMQDPFLRLVTSLVRLRTAINADLLASMPAADANEQPAAAAVKQSQSQNLDASPPADDVASLGMTFLPDVSAFFGTGASGDFVQGFDDPSLMQDLSNLDEWEANFNAIFGRYSSDVASANNAFMNWGVSAPM